MMFEQVVGHEQNKEFLSRLLRREERPHALLFYGPEGIGKRLLAREFARLLLCLGNVRTEGKPCGHCESCRLLHFAADTSAHSDYLYLDPETDEKQEKKKLKIISVDQIRGLIGQAAFGPALSRYKICIINEADTMNAEAGNSLLKLLEEPPANWLFILIASSVSRLLPTILSRVIRVRFTPLTQEEICRVLEGQAVPSEEAALLARLADGSPGQALRYRKEGVLEIRNTALQYVGAFPLKAPMTYLLTEDYFSAVIPAAGGNERLQYFLLMTISLLRDLLWIRTGLAGRLFNVDIRPQLEEAARNWNARGLHRAVSAAQEAAAAAGRRANTKSILDDITFTLNGYCEGRI